MPTVKTIGHLTIHSDCRIDWGMSLNGQLCHGIKIIVHDTPDPKDKQHRIGFHHDGPTPIWWGEKHATALRLAMNDKQIPLMIASQRHSFVTGSFDGQW